MTGAGQGLTLLAAGTGASAGAGALYTFLFYTLAVFGLAWAANRLRQSKSFLSEYFLGSRSLGVWAFALTFAATSSSGGSFMGFPAKIYTHGWILALWIASYMVVPICAIGLLGKRINQVARISGAITVPDVLRDRFRSVPLGLLATLLIVFFMAVNLVGQFKAGAVILRTLLRDVEAFQAAATAIGRVTSSVAYFEAAEPQYVLCLVAFGLAVIVYTTYGGFRAVVWTDVMQGVVMVMGVGIMLPLALYQVGGLPQATHKMSQMTPPRIGSVTLSARVAGEQMVRVGSGTWLAMPADDTARAGAPLRLFRVSAVSMLEPTKLDGAGNEDGSVRTVGQVQVVEITTPEEIVDQLDRLREAKANVLGRQINDVAVSNQPGAAIAAQLLQEELTRLPELTAAGDPTWVNQGFEITSASTSAYSYGDGRPGVYVTGPGPNNAGQSADEQAVGFLPLSLAIAFFFMWAISGAGQPHYMVRLMAFNTTRTLARSIFTVSIYYSAIYFPLVIIFCCARVLLPGREGEPDEIMPQMAVLLTNQVGQGWLAGLLVAAPFAAVMSTVDSLLLMVSSALVRDVYQRNIHPAASGKTIKRLSYGVTLAVGLGAMIGAVSPPQFLQDIIVYTGSGLAACFLAPMVYALYWPRANGIGSICAMAAGFLAHLSLYVAGMFVHGSFFTPYSLLGLDPIIFGLAVSFAAGFAAIIASPPPPDEIVRKFFYRRA